MFVDPLGKELWIIYASFLLGFIFFCLIKILLAKTLISIIIKYSSRIAAIVHAPPWNTLK